MSKNQVKFFSAILLILLVVVFSVANTEAITVNLLITSFKVPLILLIIVTFIIGAIVSYLFSYGNKTKNSNKH